MSAEVIEPKHFWPDLDNAKDLRSLLELMPIPTRVKWIRLCCLKISQGSLMRIDLVTYGDGTVDDFLGLFYSICGQNGLTIAWAMGLAENLERKRRLDGIVEDILLGRV